MDMNFKWTTRAEKLLVVEYWWEQQQGCCCICGDLMEPYHRDAGKNPNAASVEHLIPKRDNGPNTAGNVRLAHRSCNNRAGGAWAEAEHRRLLEAGIIQPSKKSKRKRPAYCYVSQDPKAPKAENAFVALDKQLVSLPRGATLLPIYAGRTTPKPRPPKQKMSPVETARWLHEQGIKGA